MLNEILSVDNVFIKKQYKIILRQEITPFDESLTDYI